MSPDNITMENTCTGKKDVIDEEATVVVKSVNAIEPAEKSFDKRNLITGENGREPLGGEC